MSSNTLIVIQARNGSTRLPFKSIMALAGQPVILHVVNRIRQVVDFTIPVVVATSINAEDGPLADLLDSNNIPFFQGDPLNVLSRFQHLSSNYKPQNIIRVTGDCPLIYAPLIHEVLKKLDDSPHIHYVSNTLNRTFPQGFDVEGFRADLIDTAHASLHDELSSEHVTPFIYNNQFHCASILAPHGADYSPIRLTLDYSQDLLFLDKLLRSYVSMKNDASIFDNINISSIRDLLQDPGLSLMHQDCLEVSRLNSNSSLLK